LAIRKIFQEVSWVTIGQGINAFFAIATLKIWAVYLAPDELGLMALILGTASTFCGVVADPLLKAMLALYSVYVEAGMGNEFRAVSFMIVTRYVTIFIVLVIAIGESLLYFFNFHWSTPLLVAVLFGVEVVIAFKQTILMATRCQSSVAMLQVGNVGFRFVFLWLFLHFLGKSAYFAVIGNLIGALILITILLGKTHLPRLPKLTSLYGSGNKQIEREILRIAWPILPSNILLNVSDIGIRYVIAAICGLNEAGIFTVTYGLLKRPLGMLSDIGYIVAMPAYIEAIAKKDLYKARSISSGWFYGILSLSIAVAALFYYLRKLIVHIFLSDSYASAGNYLIGISVGLIIFNINSVMNGILLAKNRSKLILAGNLISAVSVTIMVIVLARLWGLHGIIWGIAISNLLQFLLLCRMGKKY